MKPDDTDSAAQVRASGIDVPCMDLLHWQGLISENEQQRQAAIQANRDLITTCAQLGITRFFCVLLPHDPALGRARNHALAAQGFGALVDVLMAHDAQIVIEGWPGPGALACTPDGYAAFFQDRPEACFAINYDPSHLVRMGIDPLRFLREFAGRVGHVHAKDTAVDAEARYRYGTELGAADQSSHRWGGTWWRYCIPGHGVVDWTAVLSELESQGYTGSIAIELEDENFAHDADAVTRGLCIARDHLKGA